MPLPRPTDPSTTLLANTVFRFLQRYLRWPTFAEMDLEFEQVARLDAEDVLRAAPQGLFFGFSSGGATPQDSQPMKLSLAGLAACDDAREDMELFLATMRYAAELRDATPSDVLDLAISSETIDRFVKIPAAGRADLLARLDCILDAESWPSNGSSHDPEGRWAYGVSRYIRRLRDVADAEDYWTRIHTREASPTKVPSTDQASRVRAWVELHARPPRVVVVNASAAAIRNVVPMVGMVVRDSDGEPQAQFGGGPVGRVAELSPAGAYVFELRHLAQVAATPGAESVLHLEFDDARGQRWQLAHGQLVPIVAPRGAPVALADGTAVAASRLDLSEPAESFMTADLDRVAFLSYVHEDTAQVDRLQRDLEAAGIVVWRDVERLFPGDNIKAVIERTVREKSFAFVSCFSAERDARDRTVANRELATAIDVLQDQTSAAWLIPVAFDDTPLPDIKLGPIHGNLRDLLRAELFEPHRERAIERLIAGIQRLV